MTKQTEITRSIFNKDNQNWKKGNYATFLDQPMALYDSVNVTYPKMFDLYKLQKSMDWSEDEVALDKDRENFMTCSKNNYDIMIKTLSFQWELDSVASRAIAPLFSPFVTNSELWAMITKQTEIENLHCLTSDHDVLTPNGWISIKDVQTTDKVAQWDYDTNSIDFVNPTHKIEKDHDGLLYEFDGKGVSQLVTGEHRMPILYPYKNSHLNKPKWKFANSESIYTSNTAIPVSGFKNGHREMTPLERLYIAVQADGTIADEGYNGANIGTIHYKFGFMKERKINQMLELIEEGGWEHSIYNCESGITLIYVHVPVEDYRKDVKTFNWVDMENISYDWCCDFIDEVLKWDGYAEGKRYCTTDKENAEFVQTIGHLANKRSSIYVVPEHMAVFTGATKATQRKESYQVYFTRRSYMVGNSMTKTEKEYNGKVYCISVPNEFFLVRRNGKISVTGNSLTYSEIIRNAIDNPDEVFKEVMHNDEVTDRSTKVVEVFNKLADAGAYYTLGKYKRDDYELKKIILLGVVALYCLEKIQFQSSFACTFVLADSGIFQGIGALVKKIAQDEAVHAQMDKEILRAMLQNEKHMGWKDILDENIDEVKEIIDEVVQQEFDWNKYLFSENRSVVGLNETLLSEWVLWNAQEVYDFLEIENDHQRIKTNPLPWMDDWLDINRTQQANQESDNINYRLNSADNDLDDDEEIEL